MARLIDMDSPLTEEDVAYLRSRGRHHELYANFRRFGEPGNYHDPAEGEEAGKTISSPFYDAEARNAAVYDTGGAPLPGTTLDYDTGRVYDRDNGVTVEPKPAGHVPGGYGSRFDEFSGRDDDDSDIDSDIAEHVTSLTIPQLESKLKEHGLGVPEKRTVDSNLNTEDLVEELHGKEVQTEKTDKKADLQKKLNAVYSKERKEDMQDSLAIFLQDARRGGSELDL